MSIEMRDGAYPHVKWIDLDGDGSLTECVLMKEFPNGDVVYIKLSDLDLIDKGRMLKILTSQSAKLLPLHEVMKTTSLNNGVNALTYFHQVAKLMTSGGTKLNINSGKVGSGFEGKRSAAKKTSKKVAPDAASE